MINPAECGIGDYAPCPHTQDPLADLLAVTGNDPVLFGVVFVAAVTILAGVVFAWTEHRR